MNFRHGDKVVITKQYKNNFGKEGDEGMYIRTELDRDERVDSPTYGQLIEFYRVIIDDQPTWCIGIKHVGVPQTEWDGSGIKFRFI